MGAGASGGDCQAQEDAEMTTLNWTAIIVAIIALIGTMTNAVFFYKAKKFEKKNNKNSKNPGNPGFLCYAHGERLLKIELNNERICRELKELKQEIKDIKNRMDG